MLLTKSELALAALASKDASRYTLQAIAVDKQETVVTNGHYLLAVEHTAQPDSDFPAVDGAVPASPNGKPILLTAESATAALKALPKKTPIPTLDNALLAENGKLVTTDLTNTQTFAGHVEGTFPNWQMVVNQDKKPKAQVVLSAQYLKLIAAYLEKHGKGEDSTPVRITVYDDSTAVRFDCRTEDGRNILAVLMPIRYNAEDFAALPTKAKEEEKTAA
jgi:hypothetical protein